MSAYQVSDKTINRILSNIPRRLMRDSYTREQIENLVFSSIKRPDNYASGIVNDLANLVGEVLLRENIRSVNYRYSTEGGENFAQFYKFKFEECSVMQSLKSCDCLGYQSCETPDYEETPAFKLLKLFKEMILSSSAEYNACEWG